MKDLYKQYAGAIAYVAVKTSSGDNGIGTAFHVGEGIFVTARHVIEGNQITEVATTKRVKIINAPRTKNSDPEITYFEPKKLTITSGPFFSKDARVDIGIFQISQDEL